MKSRSYTIFPGVLATLGKRKKAARARGLREGGFRGPGRAGRGRGDGIWRGPCCGGCVPFGPGCAAIRDTRYGSGHPGRCRAAQTREFDGKKPSGRVRGGGLGARGPRANPRVCSGGSGRLRAIRDTCLATGFRNVGPPGRPAWRGRPVSRRRRCARPCWRGPICGLGSGRRP